eukprot:CAMPEP_0179152232 /NCGR_PEP_ID=MMETSP0796-20121207/73966_1 /TAXON_ID=73915 /ORGANISM="Pyrodinium bahamense, Strain pbaha01" /LENGTH=265 /DNA_ID=CAMNT_0020853421 /DNA_START=103 /DNA_END=896 /DNA_ORIENTATION=-
MITACGKSSRWRAAMQLLQEVCRCGLRPDMITYNSAIDACKRGGQPRLAVRLVEEMQGQVLQPDMVTYTAAISSCQEGHDWTESLWLFSTMSRSGCSPNLLTYNASISACERAQRWEHALVLLAEMQRKGVMPSPGSHFAVLLALIGAQRMQMALEIYRGAVERGMLRPWHVRETGVLDLHGFPAEVAKLAVRAAVLDAVSLQAAPGAGLTGVRTGALTGSWLTFVTGWGKHGDGESVLRPAISQVLQEEFGLECHADHSNPGRV